MLKCFFKLFILTIAIVNGIIDNTAEVIVNIRKNKLVFILIKFKGD